jgi:hypothetical protein
VSNWLALDAAPLITTAACLLSLFIATAWLTSRARARTNQLRSAAKLLDKHFKALQAVMENPKAPEESKKWLLVYSEAIAVRDVFLDVIEEAKKQDRSLDNRAGAGSHAKHLSELRALDGNLAADYQTAINTGVVGMALRYDAWDWLGDDPVARVLADPEAEQEIFVSELRKRRSLAKGKSGAFDEGNAAMA